MTEFLIFLTYLVQGLGLVGLVVAAAWGWHMATREDA